MRSRSSPERHHNVYAACNVPYSRYGLYVSLDVVAPYNRGPRTYALNAAWRFCGLLWVTVPKPLTANASAELWYLFDTRLRRAVPMALQVPIALQPLS